MTETKFTPGPWRVISSGLHVVSDNAPGHTVVVRTGLMEAAGDTHKQCRERWEADAHLIAAAPELYEALEEYFQAYDENPHLGPRGSKVDKAFVKARAALARARGES